MRDWGPRAESSERDSTLKGDDNDKYMYIQLQTPDFTGVHALSGL